MATVIRTVTTTVVRTPLTLYLGPRNTLYLSPKKLAFVGAKTRPFFDKVNSWFSRTERIITTQSQQAGIQSVQGVQGVQGNKRQDDKGQVKLGHLAFTADESDTDAIAAYHQAGFITVAAINSEAANRTILKTFVGDGRANSRYKDGSINSQSVPVISQLITQSLVPDNLDKVVDDDNGDDKVRDYDLQFPESDEDDYKHYLVNSSVVDRVRYLNVSAGNCVVAHNALQFSAMRAPLYGLSLAQKLEQIEKLKLAVEVQLLKEQW